MAYLLGMSENIRGQKFELKSDRTTIGRAANNDIVINDSAASGYHCYIARRGDRYVLHDMNSTNGTCLNFKRITEAELHHKEVIQIGASELMFNDETVAGKHKTTTITKVEVDPTPPTVNPKAFSSISPFGARRRDNKRLWGVLFTVIGVLAVVGIVLLLARLW